MAIESRIEWTGGTWNPWHGCTKVSPGCKRCYMYAAKRRYGQDPAVVVRSKTQFHAPLKWAEPKLIFTCSWSDWFHKTADPWRDEAWEIIRATPRHSYQILTKRPERILNHLPSAWGSGWPNAWIGASVETSDYARRIDLLREVPARIRFLSLEPLLGPLPNLSLDGIHWVIVGGESGPGYRPCNPNWVRSIRDQCLEAAVPFFFKQWGGRTSKAGGRELDGRTWDGMPA
ncbi:MAG: hypothetical protein A2X35_09270 [Elusimicrobia bacterium GWA2_61_42]|nr:MAG: hypothetical protein A2X35_09270 [Elusimicrobia bacterium GWA2_61_42]